MSYYAKRWTENEKQLYWAKSQTQRLDDGTAGNVLEIGVALLIHFMLKAASCLVTASVPPPQSLASITVKVFPQSSDNDTVSWQEDTKGEIVLCYRDGRVYLHWLACWLPHAVRTAQSPFAGTIQTWDAREVTPTPSYTVRWRDLSEAFLARRQRRNHEEVVRTLDQIWMGMAFEEALTGPNICGG